MKIDNAFFSVEIEETNGAIRSLVVKNPDCELLGESRLNANFRLCLPLEDYECNYIDGMKQKPEFVKHSSDSVTVRFSGMTAEKGDHPVDLEYAITLAGDEIRFRAKLTNHDSRPISEFWFPRLGGWTCFGEGRDAKVTAPGYMCTNSNHALFKNFPGAQYLGSEAAEWWTDYPNMTMPWTDLYDADADRGLYLGYHDTTFRCSSWHYYLYPRDTSRPSDSWLKPEEACGVPVGLVFSHIRYPFIQNGETFDTGEFILRVHKGDWHHGSDFYRAWFMKHFPFDKSKSWLRKKSAWFSSIIYQPEDRVVTDYPGFDQWCRDAEKYGIDTFELIGWDKGGLERDYPDYTPEPKFGGREGLRKLLKSIDDRGGKCLVFVNYNVLDENTECYKRELRRYTHQEPHGSTANWMSWGESTLLARKGYARRHLLSSVVSEMEKILEDHFLELVKDGAHGLQIDKVCVNIRLDFNPLNTHKPDTALCQGLVDAIERLLGKCQEINPDFRIAAEAGQDRLLPYIDVFYRCSQGVDISPLRYVFPEWTSCQHISGPYDFRGVNNAVLTGSVLCVEPFSYQGSLSHPLYHTMGKYIQEIERIRHELADILFLGIYHDTLGASITPVHLGDAMKKVAQKRADFDMLGAGVADDSNADALVYRVHGHRETGRRALLVANQGGQDIEYHWNFLHKEVAHAVLYEPFASIRKVSCGKPLRIKGESLQILVEA